MHWLQPEEDGSFNLSALQLDIVGFLAILGEGSVLANAQVSTLSKWIFLPRLIPAPQALMRPSRPLNLESVPGMVSGIFSGNKRDSVNHIGNIVCDANNLPPHSVRVVSIKRDANPKRPELSAKTIAPLTFVLFIGFALSIGLLALSIVLSDGMSIVATVVLSLLSSLIGYGNHWKLKLPERRFTEGPVPRGDVVIRYPKGSFLIVRCDEDIARQLYFAPEQINYILTHGTAYRLLSLIGTMMLMGGVICLANARIESQIAWAGAYMLLGSSYWIVAALPNKVHWNTTCYVVTNECLSDSTNAKGYPSHSETFTQALWKAIVVSKSINWVARSDACPDTKAWQEWLRLAGACSRDMGLAEKDKFPGVKTWEIPGKDQFDPQKALGDLLKENASTDSRAYEEV